MKQIILSAIFISTLFISCKKDKSPSCIVSVAGIAANYKITRVEVVSSSGNSDVTSAFLDDCKKDGLYQLKNNNSFIYTEAGSSCTGSGNGSWNIISNKITIAGAGGFQFTDAQVESWDCTTLTVTQNISLGGADVNGRFTFVKQ